MSNLEQKPFLSKLVHNMIEIIIFDFDGVIINEFEEHYSFYKKRIEGLTKEEFKSLFEGNLHEKLKSFKERDRGLDPQDNYGLYQRSVDVDFKIKEILKKLSKKYVLGIISSGLEEDLKIALHNNEMGSVFTFIYGKETHSSKVEKFKLVFENYKVEPKQCIFVTDTIGDIIEARKVGVESIAVDYGYHERKRIQKVNPLKIVSSFSELRRAIESASRRQSLNGLNPQFST
jgi:phosphoglycolate phosphatase